MAAAVQYTVYESLLYRCLVSLLIDSSIRHGLQRYLLLILVTDIEFSNSRERYSVVLDAMVGSAKQKSPMR